MKSKTSLFLVLFVFIVSGVTATERSPVAVSPGSEAGVAVVGECCPTFSWTAVEWATGYRVEVFRIITAEVISHEDIAARDYPILSKEIQGRALSWTPAVDEQLSNGSMYVWYVQAIDAYGTAMWSEGKVFKVEVIDRLRRIGEKLSETLKKYGISEEDISEVLSGIDSELEEVNSGETGLQSSGYRTTDRLGIQGNEVGSNTWYGEYAGGSLTTGLYNTFLGQYAGVKTSTGSYNTMIGFQVGYNNDIGWSNTFIGPMAGFLNSTGDENTFVGRSAGYSNTVGDYNTFMGRGAGFYNQGNYNTFLGFYAGGKNDTGEYNTYIGNESGFNNETGSGNVFLGCYAGVLETGSNKLYIDNSGSSSPLIYGEFDNYIVAVNGKLGVGTQSPEYDLEVETSGENAIFLLDRTDGAKAGYAVFSDKAMLGTVTNHPLMFAVGFAWKMRLENDNSLVMANGAQCTAGGVWLDASSKAYKENIRDLTTEEAGLTLSALSPVKYNYKKDKEDEHLGFIAEDVPDLVASKDRKGMSPMDVVAVLTKVVQEQQATLMEQQDTITELLERIAKLEKKSQ